MTYCPALQWTLKVLSLCSNLSLLKRPCIKISRISVSFDELPIFFSVLYEVKKDYQLSLMLDRCSCCNIFSMDLSLLTNLMNETWEYTLTPFFLVFPCRHEEGERKSLLRAVKPLNTDIHVSVDTLQVSNMM